MKSLVEYILASEKLYEFKVKLALPDVPTEVMDKIEHALSAYEIVRISKPKHLPITARNLDFPNFPNCDVFLITVALKYPCTDEQVRVTLSTQGRIPQANIVVIPANQPEELLRDAAEESSDNPASAMLTSELEDIQGGQVKVGTQRLDNMLRELESTKFEFASKSQADGKTTNDLPQNNISPMKGIKK